MDPILSTPNRERIVLDETIPTVGTLLATRWSLLHVALDKSETKIQDIRCSLATGHFGAELPLVPDAWVS
jgi:hypothetical protein